MVWQRRCLTQDKGEDDDEDEGDEEDEEDKDEETVNEDEDEDKIVVGGWATRATRTTRRRATRMNKVRGCKLDRMEALDSLIIINMSPLKLNESTQLSVVLVLVVAVHSI